jgi:hypothetical protein
MKFFYFFIFLIAASCTSGKKTYVCGDHTCVDRQELNEYFVENLTVEVQILKSKKNEPIDLVQLNTISTSPSPQKKTSSRQSVIAEKKLKKKNALKTQKAILKEKKKIKKLEEKNKIKNKKKLVKLKKKNNEENIFQKVNINQKPKTGIGKAKNYLKSTNKISKTKVSDDIVTFKNDKTKPHVNLCKNINDCDIDKIAELLSKKGSKKDYPNITSK